jgi:hypothetical protein
LDGFAQKLKTPKALANSSPRVVSTLGTDNRTKLTPKEFANAQRWLLGVDKGDSGFTLLFVNERIQVVTNLLRH